MRSKYVRRIHAHSIFIACVVLFLANMTQNNKHIRSTWNTEIVTLAFGDERNDSVTGTPNRTVAATNSHAQADDVELHCARWDDLDLDGWWGEHPEWEPSRQYTTRTHDCFIPIANLNKASLFRRIYQNQFHNDCSNLKVRLVSHQGFGASLKTLAIGMWNALQQQDPFQQSKYWPGFRWFYTPPYNGTHKFLNSWAACPSQDIFCYFLPLSNCVANFTRHQDKARPGYWAKQFAQNQSFEEEFVWLSQYLMRPNQQVRRRLTTLLADQAPKVPHPCTWLHVRRADATTERIHPRNFYWIQEYLDFGNMSPETNRSILVLTDDQTTLEEAQWLHPQYDWFYWNRTRHRGGALRHSHIPSNDEGLEVLILLAEVELAGTCQTAVHGTSNMVEFFRNSMILRHGIANVQLWQIDGDKAARRNNRIPSSMFVKELEEKLEAAKANRSARGNTTITNFFE